MTMESFRKNFRGRIWNKFSIFFTGRKNWKDIEYFDEEWKIRIEKMASYIFTGTHSIIDLGCGQMWLKQFLPAGCNYFGIDYKYRGEGSFVYDLNQYQYPGFNADVVFVSGCLEYIKDYKWLVNKISLSGKKVIISYCTREQFPNELQRRKLGWVNHLSSIQLIQVFSENKMKLKEQTITTLNNLIFIFENE